jgi:hypothetical protein
VIASKIIDRAGLLLSDTEGRRWPRETLLDFVNEGIRQVVLVRPDAAARVEVVQLSPGTRQSLPAGGLRLLDVIRNMGPDGASPGPAVRLAEKAALDAADAGWHGAAAGSQVDEYLYDLRRPGVFYVGPPVAATPALYVEIAYAASPVPLEAEGQEIGLDDVYAGPVLDWVMYRAFHADTESGAGRARAEHHFEAFYRALDRKTQSDFAVAPDNGSNT